MTEASRSAVSVTFWGVRGSFPSAGAATAIYGGNTPCLEVRLGERLFIVDAGTGIIPLGRSLADAAPAEIDILLSHLHLDHISGLAFFAPAFGADRVIRTWVGNLGGECAGAALDRIYAPPLFPVTLEAFPARFEHHGFCAGETIAFADGAKVRTLPMKHPSGATAFRFDHGGRAICYVSDIEHEAPWPPKSLVDFTRGADLLVYDAMFSNDEYNRCVGWGHSTIEAGLTLCQAAGIGDFAAFHHNPAHDDKALARREKVLKSQRKRAFMAREGMRLAYKPRKGSG